MRRSTRIAFGLVVAVVLAALGAWGCNNTLPTVTPTTTTTTTTETFQGTLNPNGAKTFSFTAATAGTVTATMTTVSPDSTIVLGLALGTWNGTACQIVIAKDDATQGTVLTGAASSAGTLCVRIYDVGHLTVNEDFTVTVVHPSL